jgi:hypothetical protein
MLYCPKHRAYRALRAPRLKETCMGCQALWELAWALKMGFLKIFKG